MREKIKSVRDRIVKEAVELNQALTDRRNELVAAFVQQQQE